MKTNEEMEIKKKKSFVLNDSWPGYKKENEKPYVQSKYKIWNNI